MVADPDLIATWIHAWAITRGVPPPLPYRSGHHVEVGLPDQRSRYVFATLDHDAIAGLGATIDQPWIYLKVCAAEDAVRALLPARWQIRTPPTYMMTADLTVPDAALPPGYRLSVDMEGRLRTASIEGADGVAAHGRLVIVDGIAVFDQIRTEEAHQRRGLGRAVMGALTKAAQDDAVRFGVLSATTMGRALYETLGWRVHAPYTSAVIPGD